MNLEQREEFLNRYPDIFDASSGAYGFLLRGNRFWWHHQKPIAAFVDCIALCNEIYGVSIKHAITCANVIEFRLDGSFFMELALIGPNSPNIYLFMFSDCNMTRDLLSLVCFLASIVPLRRNEFRYVALQ